MIWDYVKETLIDDYNLELNDEKVQEEKLKISKWKQNFINK